MNSSTQMFTVSAIHDTIKIQRTDQGVPQITSSNREDLAFGVGYMHAMDRMVQVMMVRTLAQGRVSERFAGTDRLIALDKHFRWLFLEKGLDQEIDKLSPDIKCELDAYCMGINSVLEEKQRPLEFLLTGYHPEPWGIRDTILTGKIMSYIGLAQGQAEVEKFIVQLIQQGVDEERIRALFPTLSDPLDVQLLREIQLDQEVVPGRLWHHVIPAFSSSNNWVISGTKTASGHPFLAADPHMEIGRLPPIWYEMVWRIEEHTTMGVTMPGLPVIVFGRNESIAWANTYGFMDMMDYFIEECRDGDFLYDGEWIPFRKRTEVIRPKHHKPIHLTFYENHHGILEGTPTKPGKYLCLAFSGRMDTGAEIFNILMHTDDIHTVREAQNRYRHLHMPTFNWVFADREGNIGYQMCGKLPIRAEGVSGLVPVPGWTSENDWRGFENPARLPSAYNPPEGFFATANNNLNAYGEANPVNLAMAPYRVDRIRELLAAKDDIDLEYLKHMQYDTHSLQAERFMDQLEPLLPDTPEGQALRDWNLQYDPDSLGAALFESVYTQLIKTTFGKYGIGVEAIGHLLERTGVFINFFGNFDEVLMDVSSVWFDEVSREEQFNEAIEAGLQTEPVTLGKSRQINFSNIFFDGRLPGFLGFDVRNVALPGSRATIPQCQVFHMLGQIAVVGPSYRMIVDVNEPGMWTNLPGGPSGNRFSPWYKTDLDHWKAGGYKKLE